MISAEHEASRAGTPELIAHDAEMLDLRNDPLVRRPVHQPHWPAFHLGLSVVGERVGGEIGLSTRFARRR
jgi:hypothetical protein